MASVGEGARFPAEAEPEVPDPGAEPEAGFDKTFCVPEQPAKATAVHRSMTAIKEVFRCISERASLSYIMLVLGIMRRKFLIPGENLKISKTGFGFPSEKNTVGGEES